MGVPKRPHHLEPFDLRHDKVRDDQVRTGLPKEVESVPPIARFNHGVPRHGEKLRQRGAESVVVLDQEDSSHA
jgi:hypothetical protein